MSLRSFLFAVTCLVIFLTSCSSKHLICDESYRQIVETDFSERESAFNKSCPELFRAVRETNDIRKKEALQFLIAYMPLNDLADFDISLLGKSVDKALQTRSEMPWGDIPESLFLSFVLPPRINNENLDSFRIAYYNEISQRVKGLNTREAALEINHWCHEKVAYQPSDSRTSSPMATILSARGRCGEESTFAVAALRTAGIPARQVYTPRWAHTDDNHAWVEVWIDGNWYYLGACEPEPVLDRGWFTEPARRAMLVHTKAFGKYSGKELIIKRNSCFTEINALPKYAVTKEIIVSVTDSSGIALSDASVDFLLYNYAELYPIAMLKSDKNGKCRFVTGLGDLVVWAHKGDDFGFDKISIPETDSLTIKIGKKHLSGSISFDLKAPVAKNPLPGPDPELVRLNDLRVKMEDSIRNSYIHSWMSPSEADSIASLTGLDKTAVRNVIAKSMGNYKTIAAFLSGSGEKASLALSMLNNISEKDLRDADGDVLKDHLINAPERSSTISADIYEKYLLSPRVDNEKLSSWRTSLRQLIPEEILGKFKNDPSSIGSWVDTSIEINSKDNYYNVPVTPAGVARLKMADAHSVKIFFVALCRTAGVASRLEPGTNRPQYYDAGKWNDVWFRGDSRPATVKSFVTFTSKSNTPAPEYYTHFTLARFDNGTYKTLEFDYNVKADEMPENLPLDPGSYMLFTGNRINDVTILTEAVFFDLFPGEHKTIEVIIRDEKTAPAIIGNIDLNKKVYSLDGKPIDIKSLSEKGIIALWIKPGTEPTRHIFADIPLLKKEFEKWGGYFIYFVDNASGSSVAGLSDYKGLPENTIFAGDNNFALLTSLFPEMNIKNAQLPVVIYANKNGEIMYFSEGYKIGIGDQIIKRIN